MKSIQSSHLRRLPMTFGSCRSSTTNFRPLFVPFALLFTIHIYFLLLLPNSAVEASRNSANPLPPLFGLSDEVFSKQAFDASAPFCKLEKEPCGFYDLSLDGNTQLEWVKSWCRCPAKHECAFDEPDLRHKVYRFVCKKEQQQQPPPSSPPPQQQPPERPRNRLVVRSHRRRKSGGTEKSLI